MASYKRGDVVLVRVPRTNGSGAALRPAVILHPGSAGDLGVSLIPLVPDSGPDSGALPVLRGSFEAARMGLLQSLSLDVNTTLDLPKALVARQIGRCPYELLNEAMRRRRSLLASASRDMLFDGPVPLEGAADEAATDIIAEAEPAEESSPATPDSGKKALTADAGLAETETAAAIFGAPGSFEEYFRVERARYTCRRTPVAIEIDGDLTKPVWQAAEPSNAFVDIVTGQKAWFDTRVRLLWDDNYLYFGFTAEETDVWGTFTERDSKLYEENDLEIFIAGRDAYYEFEISARNVIYEVFWIWKDIHVPGGPYYGREEFSYTARRTITLDGVGGHLHPRGQRWGFTGWDCPGLKHAVRVDGTLNKRDDVDRGWSAEIAIPWQSLELLADGRSLPPEDGDVWRIDCSRFQKIDPYGDSLDPCAGWTWNRHEHYDSHIPEVFPYITFSTETVHIG